MSLWIAISSAPLRLSYHIFSLVRGSRLFGMLKIRLLAWRVLPFHLSAGRYFAFFVFSHGVISSFNLFAWRFFVFSRGVFSLQKDEMAQSRPHKELYYCLSKIAKASLDFK